MKSTFPLRTLAAGVLALALQGHGAPEQDRVRPVQAPRAQILKAAERIDRLVERKLRQEGLKPNPPIGEEAFVRRIYLTAAGRIPTLMEQQAFLQSDAPNKRERLIDHLLSSQAWVHNQYVWWADLLRVKERFEGLPNQGGLQPGDQYAQWVKESLRANKPYNQMVYELVNARGGLWDKGNGAAAFYFRDYGMPLDHMSNTTQVFLGTQMQCAQCHDHPFDRWTQMDFYHMAAFTDGMGRMTDPKFNKMVRTLRDEIPREDQSQEVRNLTQMFKHLYLTLDHGGTGRIPLPKDYQYTNAKPGQVVTAKPLFGGAMEIPEIEEAETPEERRKQRRRGPPDVNSRENFAQWLIDPQNPRFSKVIANRLWKQAMGRGVFEPVDDIREDTKVDHPELLAYLEKLMVGTRYDLKEFQRIIYNTRTFQRAVTDHEVDLGAPYYFPGPIMRRLTAEQLWDSLIALTREDVDAVKPAPPAHYMNSLYQQAQVKSPEEMAQLLLKMPEQFSSAGNNMRKMGTMMQGQMNARMGFDAGPTREDFLQEIRPLQQKVRKLGKQKKWEERKEVQQQLGLLYAQLAALNHWRAAELPNPPPPGHFIREFGGSDRLVIEGGTTEATISQVLSLLNGFIDNHVLRNRHSVLNQTLQDAKLKEDKIETAFVTILGRQPYPWEVTDLLPAVDDGPRGCDNLVWALFNTHEFMAWK